MERKDGNRYELLAPNIWAMVSGPAYKKLERQAGDRGYIVRLPVRQGMRAANVPGLAQGMPHPLGATYWVFRSCDIQVDDEWQRGWVLQPGGELPPEGVV